jgi:hypothetical protein
MIRKLSNGPALFKRASCQSARLRPPPRGDDRGAEGPSWHEIYRPCGRVRCVLPSPARVEDPTHPSTRGTGTERLRPASIGESAQASTYVQHPAMQGLRGPPLRRSCGPSAWNVHAGTSRFPMQAWAVPCVEGSASIREHAAPTDAGCAWPMQACTANMPAAPPVSRILGPRVENRWWPCIGRWTDAGRCGPCVDPGVCTGLELSERPMLSPHGSMSTQTPRYVRTFASVDPASVTDADQLRGPMRTPYVERAGPHGESSTEASALRFLMQSSRVHIRVCFETFEVQTRASAGARSHSPRQRGLQQMMCSPRIDPCRSPRRPRCAGVCR